VATKTPTTTSTKAKPKPKAAGQREGVRLNKYLAQAGVASRRFADELILRGKVRVNRRTVRELGTMVLPGDTVDVSGTPVAPHTELTYLVMHKPVGVVTTMRDPQRRRTIVDMLPRGPRIVPVGRLDFETSGVLLLTNDGALANALTHPKYGVEKTYRATIAGRLDAADIQKLHDGVTTREYQAGAAKIRVVAVRRDHSVVDITIHEGRNRQVRDMFEALGHPVLALTRLRFGPIALGDLPAGHTRPLLPKEMAALERIRDTEGPTSSPQA
jgi:23S rRNA pseudouridine2605 synthase